MIFYLPARLSPLLVMALLLGGCGAAATDETVAGPGMTDLAPTYDARASDEGARPRQEKARKKADAARSGAGAEQGTRPTSPKPQKPARSAPPRDVRATTPARVAAATSPGPVRVSDPSGDLSRSLEGAPASADIVAVQVSRRGGSVEVRTTFAAAVPTRQSDNKGMNVASFYDVDDNGVIDYEVWASLADNGWGTGHLDRREEKASFGPSTGIEVSVEGSTLVTRFPVDRIGGADAFRWSAASEWGSYESMAASTSARDYAPDEGSVDYPG